MPSDLLGSDGGRPERIHTFTSANVAVLDDDTGEKLDLAPGTVATLRMRGWRKLGGSDPAPQSWSFDPATGTWLEEGACTVDPGDPQYVLCDLKSRDCRRELRSPLETSPPMSADSPGLAPPGCRLP